MKFPAYVPAAVRDHITTHLDGRGDGGWRGWHRELLNLDAEIDRLNSQLAASNEDSDASDDIRVKRSKVKEQRDELSARVACLQRLATDPRMRDAYTILAGEFEDDADWRNFVYASWAAVINVDLQRTKQERAIYLANDIANKARELAGALEDFASLGIPGPPEFDSIRATLASTDNVDLGGFDFHEWRAVRPVLLGETPQECRNQVSIGYAWTKAPSVASLLHALASAARLFIPQQSGMIAAAIGRESNSKTEYLRAMAHLLQHEHHIEITGAVMRAIAIVATVVLDQPDLDVSYDDVRKTLKRLG